MYIECDHCHAGYELELPAAALSGGRSVKFRCTACGHSFHVVKHGQAVAESTRPAPPVVEAEALQHVLLRQDGVSYHVPDVATLQRWIVERRVAADDELDFGGGRWVMAGDRPDLAPFFAIVSEVETGAQAAPLPAMPEPAPELALKPEPAPAPAPAPEPVPAPEPEPEPAPEPAPEPVPEPAPEPEAAPGEDTGGSVPSVWAEPPGEDTGGPEAGDVGVGTDAGSHWSNPADSLFDISPDDTLSDGLFPPFDAADEDGFDAPDPLGLSPESGVNAPSWADELFEDAPMPGVLPPEEEDEDDLYEDEADDGPEVDSAVGSGGEPPGPDKVSQHEEEAGWFEREDVGGGENGAQKKGGGGWLAVVVIGAAIASLIWLGIGPGHSIPNWLGSGSGSGDLRLADGAGGAATAADAAASGKAGKVPGPGEAKPGEAKPEEGAGGAAGEASKPASAEEPGKSETDAAPPPAAKKPVRRTADSLVSRGWLSIERKRLDDAEKHFRDALKIRSTHADAHFGLGYIAERRSNPDGAVIAYCKARSFAAGQVSLLREVDGRLAVMGRTCP